MYQTETPEKQSLIPDSSRPSYQSQPSTDIVIVGSGPPSSRGPRRWLKKIWRFVWPVQASTGRRIATVGGAVIVLISIPLAALPLTNTGGIRDVVTNGGDAGGKSWLPFNGARNDSSPGNDESSDGDKDDENGGSGNGNGGLGSGNGTPGPGGVGGNGSGAGNGGSGNGSNGGNGGNGGTSPGECPPFPAFPDQNCTGWQHTGVTLDADECPQELTVPNATYDSCLFTSYVLVLAENVTITRSKIEGRVATVWTEELGDSLRGLTLRDVEIDGMGDWGFNQAAIGNSDYTCIRCHIHNTGRGANIEDNVHIEDSYLHGWVTEEGDHETAIGSNGGSGNKLIHNNLLCDSGGCSAALSLYGDFAPINDWLIERNLFNTTSGGYCTHAGSDSFKPFPNATNVRYIDNRFGKTFNAQCGVFGPVTSWAFNTGNVWSGNAWADGSGSVEP